MARIIHRFDNTSGITRRATAYRSDNPNGEVITATGTSGNARVFSYFAETADIPGSGTTGSIGTIGCHGADTEIPLPYNVSVVMEASGSVGINTTPTNFKDV